MFGHDDNQQTQSQDEVTTVEPTTAVEPATDMVGFTPPPTDPVSSDDASSAVSAPTETLDVSIDSVLEGSGSPELPGNLTTSEPITDASAAPEPATTAPTQAVATEEDSDNTPAPSGELIDLKQEALQSLSPLVEKLDQTPEERFRTTMMMIQATDDSSKIRSAYEAAQKIEDEKVRAQALLDVVNEINYFTQQEQKDA